MSQSKTREDNELPLESSIPVISLNNFTEGSHLIFNNISLNFEKKHTIIEEISEFWASNEHPDLLVCIGNEKFPCHRLLLSVYTDVVQLAQGSGKLELPADQVPAKGFQQAYKWMLDGRTDLEQSLLVEILAVAKFLNIDELVQVVWYWLDKPDLFYEDQAFLVAHRALLLGRVMNLDTLMMQRIKCFFLTLVASREFISLPVENVCALLQSDELAVNTEKEVFFSAIRWLTHHWPARKEYVTTVLKTVRMALLPYNFLKQLQSPPIPDEPELNLISELPEVASFLRDACFAQTLTYYSDGTHIFNQICGIFEFQPPVPRKFICHDLALHHKAEPNESQSEFYYKAFLRYLAILQNLKPYAWRKLQPQDLEISYKPC
ncbi:kelch-like protein 1 isoform X1 [Drosophila tropicalis]|uniref:kelch-like protein 1 isoform X1 n=1 Tax=Drosophila tropicalis TaxID=46794 RepID=UPI0035AC0920